MRVRGLEENRDELGTLNCFWGFLGGVLIRISGLCCFNRNATFICGVGKGFYNSIYSI